MSFETVESKLAANLAVFGGLKAKVAFDFGAEGRLVLDATAAPPTLARQGDEVACTIRATTETLLKLIEGQLDPMLAFTLGKIKIDGSMGVAMKLSALLEA